MKFYFTCGIIKKNEVVQSFIFMEKKLNKERKDIYPETHLLPDDAIVGDKKFVQSVLSDVKKRNNKK